MLPNPRVYTTLQKCICGPANKAPGSPTLKRKLAELSPWKLMKIYRLRIASVWITEEASMRAVSRLTDAAKAKTQAHFHTNTLLHTNALLL